MERKQKEKEILQRVAGVSLCQILLQVVIVLHRSFLLQIVIVLYHADYKINAIVSLPINSGQKDLRHAETHVGDTIRGSSDISFSSFIF